MRSTQGDLEARHEGVHIIPWVADERQALLVARKIATSSPEQQFRRICLVVEIGCADRTGSIERLEIGTRGASVSQRIDVAVRAQGRSVGRQIVCQVLAEEGLASFDVALGVTRAPVADAALTPKGKQAIVVEARGRQVREHASIAAALNERSIDGATRCEAQVARWMGRAGPGGRWDHVRSHRQAWLDGGIE